MLAKSVELNDGTEKVTTEMLTGMLGDVDLKVVGFFDHTKASERYVIVSSFESKSWREWYLPFYYRRTNVRIDTLAELVEFIRSRRSFLSEKTVAAFKSAMKVRGAEIIGKGANVTLPIFSKLLANCGEWVWNKDFENPNPQRRIQDIKECGFTIATKIEGRQTYHMLLPFDVVKAPTYETIPSRVRKAIFAALGGIDAFSGCAARISVLPDHKFPEIRWEKDTAESNERLSEGDMRDKFQLVPEWVNQAKREVCRKCFQTGVRGKLNGIDFFYHWGEKWPSHVPTTGTAAKVGCMGCFWYDMVAWRNALNKIIRESKSK